MLIRDPSTLRMGFTRNASELFKHPLSSASAVYASRATSPPPRQDALPAAGVRLCREGVDPSGSLRKVSGYIPFSFPGLLLSQGRSYAKPERLTDPPRDEQIFQPRW